MKKTWLAKHRLVNEIGKLGAASICFYFGYMAWLSHESNSDFGAGVFAGLVGSLGVAFLTDTAYSLKAMLTNKKGSEDE